VYTFDEVCKILKQKSPFIFIDKVLEVEYDSRIVAIKNISGCEMFSTLHFPGNSVYPGILIIESVAQATAVLCHLSKTKGAVRGDTDESLFMALGGIQQFQFLSPARPGDTLEIEVLVRKLVGDLMIAGAEVRRGSDVIAKGQLSFGVVKSENS